MRKKIQTKYHQIEIIDIKGIRYLCSGDKICRLQSAICLNNLDKNIFDYSLLAMYSLKFVSNPLNILSIGLGAGVVPRQLSRYKPNSTIDVLEIDSDIVKIAKDYFLFEDNSNITVHVADAFMAVEFLEKTYDIIILDATMTNYLPFPLITKEFFDKIKLILNKNGVIAANVCNTHHTFMAEINTLRQVFGDNIYEIQGLVNNIMSMLYICDQEPLNNLDLPIKYYPDLHPKKIEITTEVKNTKILSLKNV